MLHEQTIEKLYTLRLHGMAQALQEQMKAPDVANLAFEERLAMLVDAQWLWKENRALSVRLKNASLKHHASIENINYRHARQLDRSQMRSLASCQWVQQHQNVLITGPTGIGKSYLCCALLEKACREGYSAYYAQAHKLFRQLAAAYVDGSYDKLLSRIAKTDVLAIDDWALIPLTDSERRHLFEVIEDRHGSRSTVVTSQFPVENWHELIGSPSMADATIDRIVQGAHRITLLGETMRDPEVAAQMQESPDLATKEKTQASRSRSPRDVKKEVIP
jgi:DNA replication protein DnaC